MSTLTFEQVRGLDFERIEDADGREQMRIADAEAREVRRVSAKRFEWHAALIKCAVDPLAMVDILTPLIICPETGLPHPTYTRIAHDEVRRRRASVQSAAEARRRAIAGGARAVDNDTPMQH
jgi:hypothetical protein